MSKKSTYIKIFLIILIFIFVILIGLIRNIRKNDNKHTKTHNNTNSSNSTYDNNVEYNEQFDIFNNTEQQAEVPYSDDHLNNFEFKITNIPDEVLEKINDKENFYKEIKKFVYLNGLIEATEANFYDYRSEEDIEDNKIAMRFLLDNVEKNMLLLVLNMETGEIEISNMKYNL